MIPFVLTGTIVPNAFPTVCDNVQQRLDEYRRAIRFYLACGPVYFVENSGYPVMDDAFFARTDGLHVIPFPRSAEVARGKGYQEFEMLDAFVAHHLHEDAFIKITGRYLYKNIDLLAPRMIRELERNGIVIDMNSRLRMATSSLFAVTRPFYDMHLRGAYADMDDSRGRWAEHVLYSRVKGAHAGVFLRPAPVLQAVTSSMGNVVDMKSSGFRHLLRNLKRNLFAAVGLRELPF